MAMAEIASLAAFTTGLYHGAYTGAGLPRRYQAPSVRMDTKSMPGPSSTTHSDCAQVHPHAAHVLVCSVLLLRL